MQSQARTQRSASKDITGQRALLPALLGDKRTSDPNSGGIPGP